MVISWARWSETAGSRETIDRISVKEERVMNRSRMCLELWVLKLICWVSEKESRSLRKIVEKEARFINVDIKISCDKEFGRRSAKSTIVF